MNISKKYLIAAASAASIGALGLSATALAATGSTATPHYSPLVQKIASTFNLDPAKVQKVVRAERKSNGNGLGIKSYLDAQVKAGKITQAQENSIIAELKSLRQTYRADVKSQKQSDFSNLKTQLQQWLNDNGYSINLDQLSDTST